QARSAHQHRYTQNPRRYPREVQVRFEAQLVKLTVLREVSPWRVKVAGATGESERWITGARLRPLEVLYDELGNSLRDPVWRKE
ncbi:hypothetical protein, partial [Brachybacterium sp. UMB0905]|uniref:hypothetical protein n=1 Tax=Brachybacterium sp. UMB0905 TaxID=2069310 RepID=UPI001E49A067